jgi:hypothetical protein
MGLEELLGELFLRALFWMGRLVWERFGMPVDPDAGRLRLARAFLAQNAVRRAGGVHNPILAQLGAERGSAEVAIDRGSGRVRIACAWQGDGPVFAAIDPRSRVLGPLLRPLKRAAGVDRVSSNGETIEIGGFLELASELDAATRALHEIASAGRRARTALDARGLCADDGWHVDVELGGVRVRLHRRISGDVPWSFELADGRVRGSCAPAHVVSALAPCAVRVVAEKGVITLEWPWAPADRAVARARDALDRLAPRPAGPYR